MNIISRRRLFGQAGIALSGMGIAAVNVQSKASSASNSKKARVIVAGGHPGDPEYGCGGTIARYTDMGHEVALLYLNQGDPAETPVRPASAVRVKEAENACAILRARPIFAGQIDGHAIVDAEHYTQFRHLLEAEKPDAVFTHWPIDNHADHRAMSMLVYDAWLQLGRAFALYYYEVSPGEDTVQFAPTHYVDISKMEPRKRLACYAHASQAPDRFYALQQMVSRMRGIESGSKQAEAFVHHIQSPDFALPVQG